MLQPPTPTIPNTFEQHSMSDMYITLKQLIIDLQDQCALAKSQSQSQSQSSSHSHLLKELVQCVLLARRMTNLLLLGDNLSSSSSSVISSLQNTLTKSRNILLQSSFILPSRVWTNTLLEERQILEEGTRVGVPKGHTGYSWGWGDDGNGGVPKSHTIFR